MAKNESKSVVVTLENGEGREALPAAVDVNAVAQALAREETTPPEGVTERWRWRSWMRG